MVVGLGASKFGPNFEVRIRSETLTRCGEVVSQQTRTLVVKRLHRRCLPHQGVPPALCWCIRGLVVCLAPALSLILFTKCRGDGVCQCAPANNSCKLATRISCDARISPIRTNKKSLIWGMRSSPYSLDTYVAGLCRGREAIWLSSAPLERGDGRMEPKRFTTSSQVRSEHE
jgi:hypothetical protein